MLGEVGLIQKKFKEEDNALHSIFTYKLVMGAHWPKMGA